MQTCNTCNGEGGYVHPDGLSSHECPDCNGMGVINNQTTTI